MNNIISFLNIVILQGWTTSGSLLSILIPLVIFVMPESYELKTRFLLAIASFGVLFLLKVIKQFYGYYQGFLKPIKVIRMVQGDGVYIGQSIIILENPGYLRDNTLLTLFSKSSGAHQPICILKIVKVIKNEDILTIQIVPKGDQKYLSKYFDEDSRKHSLYAVPLINDDEISVFEQMNIK